MIEFEKAGKPIFDLDPQTLSPIRRRPVRVWRSASVHWIVCMWPEAACAWSSPMLPSYLIKALPRRRILSFRGRRRRRRLLAEQLVGDGHQLRVRPPAAELGQPEEIGERLLDIHDRIRVVVEEVGLQPAGTTSV
jgi:hypothetical protein